MPEPSTEILYASDMDMAYEQAFEARITKRGDNYVVLDRTLFYPEGGGQECDTGTLSWDGGSCRVVRVEKKGIVKHIVDALPPPGIETVRGLIDWDRRHAHMRMHTSQHLISALVYDLFGGVRTVGNQIHATRSRIDFRPAKFGPAELSRIEDATNAAIAKRSHVEIKFEKRTDLEKRVKPDRANLDLLPAHVQDLRVIEIAGFDACPCGGTHVQNLAEIGHVKIIGATSKGAETTRIEYELAPPHA